MVSRKERIEKIRQLVKEYEKANQRVNISLQTYTEYDLFTGEVILQTHDYFAFDVGKKCPMQVSSNKIDELTDRELLLMLKWLEENQPKSFWA